MYKLINYSYHYTWLVYLLQKTFKLFGFSIFWLMRAYLMHVFQKSVESITLDIYVFITITGSIPLLMDYSIQFNSNILYQHSLFPSVPCAYANSFNDRDIISCHKYLHSSLNIVSVISWRSVLLVKETGVPGENRRPVASHWQHNVVSSSHCHLYHIMLYRVHIVIFIT
jgi:hypothetical protein